MRDLALVPNEPDQPEQDFPPPVVTASNQVLDARDALGRRDADFLKFPWSTLDDLVGGISRGEVWFVGAFSGHGKTTFLTSALDAWFGEQRRIYYMGLESRPWILRTHWACKRLGLDAGDVLSGKAAEHWDNWEETRKRLALEVMSQSKFAAQVYFAPEMFVNLNRLRAACEHAAELESDVVIIDHIDHVQAEGRRSVFEESREVIMATHDLAEELSLRLLIATQFNHESLRGNRIGLYQPPQPHHVYMGGHKRHVASGMLGLYRPLKFHGVDKALLQRFKAGSVEPREVVEPNTMAVVLMKHRLYGNREGQRAFLRVERGRVTEPPLREDGQYNV